MKKGQLVRFCKNPPKNVNHCHMWKWSHGILLDFHKDTEMADILFDQKIYKVSIHWIDSLDEKD